MIKIWYISIMESYSLHILMLSTFVFGGCLGALLGAWFATRKYEDVFRELLEGEFYGTTKEGEED